MVYLQGKKKEVIRKGKVQIMRRRAVNREL